jgi:hypothetical protein
LRRKYIGRPCEGRTETGTDIGYVCKAGGGGRTISKKKMEEVAEEGKWSKKERRFSA